MAKRPTISPISFGGASEALNQNFNNLAAAFDNTVSRDGSTPNQMNADLDMNGYSLLNIDNLDVTDIIVGGKSMGGLVLAAETAALAAQAAEDSAETSAFEADEARDAAVAASADVQGATLYAADLSALLANITPSYTVGTVFGTRAEGYSYEVVASGGHVVTAGGVNLRVVQKSRVPLLAYGAVGDGIADDAAVITTAVADARARGMILDGDGLTYRIGTPLTVTPGRVENMTIDASAITASTVWAMSGANLEAEKTITANVWQGGRQMNVTAHGYAVGDIILARSNMVLETGTNSVCAHWAEVVEVTANTFKVSHATLCNLLTANNARVQRLPKTDGVHLRNVRIIGSATCPAGIEMTRLTRPVIEDYEAINTEIRGLSLVNCYAPRTGRVHGEKCDRPGLGYAINVSGCGWSDIGITTGRRCRHVLTWGAVLNIPCVGGTYADVVGVECTGSVFDTHPAVLGVWQRSGIVLGDMAVTIAGQDAITMQAAGGSCRAKITGTGHRHVCLVQTFHNAAAFQSFPSIEVDIEGDTAGGQIVLLDVVESMGLRTASIVARGSASGESAFVRVANGSAIGSVTIDGRGVSSGRAVLINQQVSGQISYVRVSGSWRAENNTVSTVQVLGPTSTGAVRTNISVAGMDASGGAYGLRLSNRADAKGASIAFLSGFTSATSTDGGATIA